MFLLIVYILAIDDIVGRMFSLYLPIYLKDIMKLDAVLIGLTYSGMNASRMIGRLFAGYFIDKYKEKISFLINSITSSFFVILFMLLSVNSTLKIYAIFILFVGVFFTPLSGIALRSYIAKNVSRKLRATAFSGLMTVWYFFSIPAPYLGILFWNLKPQLIFIIDSLASLSLIPLTLKFLK